MGRRIAQPSSSDDVRTWGGIGVGPFGSASFVSVAVRRQQRLGRRILIFLWLSKRSSISRPAFWEWSLVRKDFLDPYRGTDQDVCMALKVPRGNLVHVQ